MTNGNPKELHLHEHHNTSDRSFELLVIYGPYKGNRYSLQSEIIHIGRDDSNDIILQKTDTGEIDYSISRRHAIISFRAGKYYLADRISKSRTYLNKKKLNETDEVILKVGDEIEIRSQHKSTILRMVRKGSHAVTSPVRFNLSVGNTKIYFPFIAVLFFMSLIYVNFSLFYSKVIDLKLEHEIWSSKEIFNSNISGNRNLNQPAIMPTPGIMDLYGDGDLDLIMQGPDGSFCGINLKTRQIVWPKKETKRPISKYSVTLADVNNDNLPEIFVSGKENLMTGYDGASGDLCWRQEADGGELSSQPAVSDVLNNGNVNVVVSSTKGSIYIGYPLEKGKRGEFKRQAKPQTVNSIPVITDIDLDGKNEILVGTNDGKMMISKLNETGINSEIQDIEKIINISFYGRLHSISNAIAIGTINDKRDSLILVINSRDHGVSAFNPSDWKLYWFDEIQDIGYSKPTQPASPIICDLNNDNEDEIIIASSNGILRAYQAKQNKKILWEFKPSECKGFVATPALGDFNSDGVIDIVAPDISGIVYIIDGAIGKAIAVNQQAKNVFTASPLIADCDGDKFLDIVLIDAAYNIHFYKTNRLVPENLILWNQFGYSAEHSLSFQYHDLKIGRSFKRIIWSNGAILGIFVLFIFVFCWRKK